MKSFKNRASAWFSARRLGSMENLDIRPVLGTPLLPQRPNSKSQFELTSIKIKHLLEKRKYQKVVEVIREQNHEFILKCLESFPFKALNKAVPESFAIWETLLMKLHNSEDGYIPQFPYAACDELVLEISRVLELCEVNSPQEELTHACRRVLKKVYMQYNDVLEGLYKEHDRVQHALYTLTLHMPLGTDSSAVSLQQAIMEEVQASLVDFTDAVERLEELTQKEVLTLTEALMDNQHHKDTPSNMVPSPNQLQLQERLYFNHCVLTSIQPSRRRGNLGELREILNERIRGDKEVLAIFGSIRQRNESITDSEAIEPWLRRHLCAVECTITTLKEIEKELEITLPKIDSPSSPYAAEEGPLIVPVPIRSRYPDEDRPHFGTRRHSATVLDECVWEEEEGRRLSFPQRRPRSASPHKILRTNGPISGSIRSFDSSGGSNNNLATGTSASVHDLHNTVIETQPSVVFTRTHSLKAPKTTISVVAGKKKSAFSFFNLSASSGNVSTKKSKKMSRTGSGGLVNVIPLDRQVPFDEMSASQFMLQQELEYRNNELRQAREHIQELRKRERVLTDRLSEQAQRHLQDSEKFEDILLGTSRPTLVIQRYQELYSQGRVEALDAIETIENGDRIFSTQLVLDVMKFAYFAAWSSLERLSGSWKESLGVDVVQESLAVKQLESAVGVYLRRMSSHHDVATILQDVESYLSEKYGNSPSFGEIMQQGPFRAYIEDCAKVSWDLCVQSPPMVINFSETEFNCDLHTRFYNADKGCSDVIIYLWPTLLLSSSGPVLFRGVVMT